MNRRFASRSELRTWPGLVLALALVIFVLGSVRLVGDRLRAEREQELLIHAHAVGAAVKAQLFERYADSQAFSLHPTFLEALRGRKAQAMSQSLEVQQALLSLYQVYRASVLTDRDGRFITGAIVAGGKAAALSPSSAFPGVNAKSWLQADDPQPTLVSEFELVSELGSQPLQKFSSPVRGPSGDVLGVITNYTSGLYLEREMIRAFEGFRRLDLPEMTIYLRDQSGRLIALFSEGEARFWPQGLSLPAEINGKSGILEARGRLYAWQALADPRIHEAVPWSVILASDSRAFFADIERLRWISYTVSILIVSLLIYAGFVLHQMRVQHERTLSRRLHEVQEEERASLSREIHDDLGQNLTAIKIHLSRLATDLSGFDPKLQAKIEDAGEMLEETSQVVRRISRELHPSLVEQFGLEAAVKWKFDQAIEVLGVHGHFEVAPGSELESQPLQSKIHVFRIVQECLNNIQKHSRCTEITMKFGRDGRWLVFEIRDNGVGFKPEVVRDSLGLRSIQERAALIGAQVRIEAKPGHGTVVLGRIPLRKEGKNAE